MDQMPHLPDFIPFPFLSVIVYVRDSLCWRAGSHNGPRALWSGHIWVQGTLLPAFQHLSPCMTVKTNSL